MRHDCSQKGRGSLSLIWWVTTLSKPTSHSSVENTLLRSANFRRNLCSQAVGMVASPKLNNAGIMGPLNSWTQRYATVTVSVRNTWAITVPAGIERSLLVSLWIKTLKLFTFTEEGMTAGEKNSPERSGSTEEASMIKISFLKGLSDSTLHKGYRSPWEGTLKVPGPSHFTLPSGRSAVWLWSLPHQWE